MIDVYAFALLTAVTFGASPICEKRAMVDGGTPLQGSIVVVIVETCIFFAILLALRSSQPFSGLTFEALVLFTLAGIIGTALGRLSLFVGVDYLGASINNAILSTRPVFASGIAVVWLGESISIQLGMGILLIVAGLVVLTSARGGDVEGWQSWHVIFPLGGAAAFGVTNVMRRWGLLEFDVTALEGVAINEFAALVVLVAYAGYRHGGAMLDISRRSVAYFSMSGVLTATAMLSLFTALDRGPVSIVDPLYGAAPLFTAIFAFLFLRGIERITPGIVIGAVLIVSGAALITTV